MTSAKIQPFGRNYSQNLGVYNVKRKANLPRSATQRNVCLYIRNNQFCVIRKKNRSTFPDAMKELEENIKYEDKEFSGTILKQREKYKFRTTDDKNCMYAVFAFDLET